MNVEAAQRPLRVCVLLSGLSGLLALAMAGLLSVPATVAVAGCFVAASAASVWLASPGEARLRRGASIAVLLLVGGFAGNSALAGLGTDPFVAVGPVLALLLCGLLVAHALVLNVRRDLLVGLTIGLFMTVLAAGLAPGPAVALPLLIGWPLAVTALVLAQRLEQLETGILVASPPAAGRPSSGRPIVASTAAAVAVSLVAGLIVFLLLPQPTGLSARSRLLGNAQVDESSPQVRDLSDYSGGIMDLRARGSLSDVPVLDVPGDSPLLWRATVLSSYDGQTWTGATASTMTFDKGGPTFTLTHPADPLVTGASRTDTVHLLAAFQGIVVAPGVAVSITVDGRLLSDGSGGLLIGPSLAAGPPTSYTITSVPPAVDSGVLAAAKGPDPADAARWLQLPPTLPQRVLDLAQQVTAGQPTRHDEVRAVEDYLRSHYRYQLDSPLPAPGADAVDDFLFTSKVGFCEQFASAEVVLLRARGVPARLATGLAYGTVRPDGSRRMLVSDSHAWVEVWYPGLGWSPSDPTAGSTLATAGGASFLSRLVHATLDTAARRLSVAVVVGLLALVLTLALRWRLGRGASGRRRRSLAGPPAGPVLAAFRRLEDALDRAGRPRRPGETIGELRARLPSSGSAALRTLEHECYGGSPPPPAESALAAESLDELARGLAEVTGR